MAARRNLNPAEFGDAPFKATHVYRPVGWDQFDSKPHPGSRPITPEADVRKHPGQFGRGPMAFVHIEDEHGNHQQVFKKSIVSRRQAMSSSSDAMRFDPSAGDQEIAAWKDVLHPR